MPGEDLSRGRVALFGKLPATGDFVRRGLPGAFGAWWDRWLTRNLASRAAGWPAGGLRMLLSCGDRSACALVLPSRDSVGRRFPLSALVMLDFPAAPDAADAWCEAGLPVAEAACRGRLTADALWAGLDALPPPARAGLSAPALLLWARGRGPVSADPGDPGDALSLLFSSGGSSRP